MKRYPLLRMQCRIFTLLTGILVIVVFVHVAFVIHTNAQTNASQKKAPVQKKQPKKMQASQKKAPVQKKDTPQSIQRESSAMGSLEAATDVVMETEYRTLASLTVVIPKTQEGEYSWNAIVLRITAKPCIFAQEISSNNVVYGGEEMNYDRAVKCDYLFRLPNPLYLGKQGKMQSGTVKLEINGVLFAHKLLSLQPYDRPLDKRMDMLPGNLVLEIIDLYLEDTRMRHSIDVSRNAINLVTIPIKWKRRQPPNREYVFGYSDEDVKDDFMREVEKFRRMGKIIQY